jgi:hypothetical protein
MSRQAMIRAAVIGIIATGLIVAGSAPAVRAVDDRVDDANDPTAERGRQQANVVDLGANFDANVFDRRTSGFVLQARLPARVVVRGGVLELDGGEHEESPTLERARQQGEVKLERIDRLCGLSEAQRLALHLAIESDIRRVAEDVDATRATYRGMSVNISEPDGRQVWQRFQQDIQRSRRLLQDLFAADSLFAAALASTLDADQYARLEIETRAKRSFRWRAIVADIMLKFDDSLGLTAGQHAAVEAVLLAHEPPLRIDDGPRQPNAHAEQMLVLLVLSQADQTLLRETVSERQWRSLAMLMNQGKAMKSWLEQQNLLEPSGQDR